MRALPTQPTRALLLNTCRHAFCLGHSGQACGQRSTKRWSLRAPLTLPLPLSLRSWLFRAPSVKGAGEEAWGSFSILTATHLLINFNFGLLGGPSRRKTHLTHSLTGSLSPSFFNLSAFLFLFLLRMLKRATSPGAPLPNLSAAAGGAPRTMTEVEGLPLKKIAIV